MTRPVPGPTSPESRGTGRDSVSPDSKKFQDAMKKVERVDKVSESEFEKQQKRPFHEVPEEEEEEEDTLGSDSGISDLKPLPSPSAVNATPLGSEPSKTQADDLPRSQAFWQETDLPDAPPKPAQLQETPAAGNKKKSEKENHDALISEKKKKKELAVAIQLKKESEEKQKTSGAVPWHTAPSKEEALKKEKEAPVKKQALEDAEKRRLATFYAEKEQEKLPKELPKEFLKEKTSATVHSSKQAEPLEKVEKKATLSQIWEPEKTNSKKFHEEKEKADLKKKDSKNDKLNPGFIPEPLPSFVQSVAASAQISAAPYLSPETAALFSKLVGTIFFMTSATPGISRTEIVLNADSFRNSPFYNSKIVLEKYATAPDAFNIRLIGNPEATKTFDQNSGNLIAAFTAAYEERRVQFRIGRLEVSLDMDKPLFRRKESIGKEGELLQ